MALSTVQNVRDRQGLHNTSDYPTEAIQQGLDIALEGFEKYCGVKFSSTQETLRLNGNNTPRLLIKRSPIISVDSVTIDGEAQTITDWFMDEDYLVRADYQAFIHKMYPQILVTVTHGYATVPAAIEAAAEQYAHHWADQLTSETPLTATQQIGDFGTYNISVAGRGSRKPTGIPSVDVVLNQYKVGF